jgi:hypothetical protein
LAQGDGTQGIVVVPLTLGDLVTEVLFDEFDRTKYGTLVARWLNEGAQKVSRAVRLPVSDQTTTIAVTAGTTAYVLAGTIERVYSVQRSDGRYLREVDIEDAMTNGTGSPLNFAIYGGEIHLWPSPRSAETLTVRFRGDITQMSQDTDPVNVPEDYADLLVNYARSKAFTYEDDIEMSNHHRALFEAELQRAREAIQARTEGGARQVQGMMTGSSAPRFHRP